MNNFVRNVHCILGLPFDAVSMSDTLDYIRYSAKNNKPCFISTPNLNFLIASQNDPDFRNSVFNSDLSIADGMPVIWVARILGLPLFERVAGSNLYEKLSEQNLMPLKAFFFGGDDGVAERACQRQNSGAQGIIAVGYEAPGFGSVEDMSTDQTIKKINASDADFIVVALGAKKGQAWIERNRSKLKAPIISHLGAVVNFVAGNVKRAPHWLQRFGLEWLWRIYQEPKLWIRYTRDGARFCRLMFTKVFPYALWKIRNKKLLESSEPILVDCEDTDKGVRIIIKGICVNNSIEPLKTVLNDSSGRYANYELDLQQVALIDSSFIGLCMLLTGYVNLSGGKLILSNISEINKKIIKWNCAGFLLSD
ncbi:MAG: WecB/TagA/CpsF family glycosyltransferase [Methylomonas sp.]|jgi:N-acetylglucosaminyldiphosphoundecaprenol N-acetyl-beta-D-mannosaminyltransferase